MVVEQVNGYSCVCVAGYTDAQCQTDVYECSSNPCQNGFCIDEVNRYRCQCTPGYVGSHCETNVDECAGDGTKCQNGGRCLDGVNKFDCDCSGTGFFGAQCTVDENNCINHNCQNGATCADTVNAFTCRCRSGFEGDRCQTGRTLLSDPWPCAEWTSVVQLTMDKATNMHKLCEKIS